MPLRSIFTKLLAFANISSTASATSATKLLALNIINVASVKINYYPNQLEDQNLLQTGSLLDANIESLQSLSTDSQQSAMNGVRLVLKRRQKYLYDYFFPKNMRDSVDQHKETKKTQGNGSLAQGKHMNQCELNKNNE